MTHIYASVDYTVIGSDNIGRLAIIWTNAGSLVPWERTSAKFESKYEFGNFRDDFSNENIRISGNFPLDAINLGLINDISINIDLKHCSICSDWATSRFLR